MTRFEAESLGTQIITSKHKQKNTSKNRRLSGANDPFRSREPQHTDYYEQTQTKKPPKNKRLSGANDPIRTGDLLITSELLYRLSHISIHHLYNYIT